MTDELVDVTIEGLGERGDGVATFEDKPLYVSDVIVGERVRVRVRKRYRSCAVGEIETILDPSSDRVEPRCPLVGTCSGCQFQHLSYPAQLVHKQKLVQDALDARDLATTVTPTTAAPDPWHYRNHGRFTVQQGELGFVQQRQKTFFRVDHCYLMDPGINDVLERLQGHLEGASQCNVRVGARSGDRMVQPALDVDDLGVASGQKYVHENLGGRAFRIAAPAFFQVHTAQAEAMCQLVVRNLQTTKTSTVVDAYAGVGMFAAALAPHVARVIAIEESSSALEDAAHNLADLTNVELRCGRTEDLLGEMTERVDAMILDPPRSGCHRRALEAVLRSRPRRVAYVSCDPRSLARDLSILDAGYTIEEVRPVDMFPHTRHIECVATLAARH